MFHIGCAPFLCSMVLTFLQKARFTAQIESLPMRTIIVPCHSSLPHSSLPFFSIAFTSTTFVHSSSGRCHAPLERWVCRNLYLERKCSTLPCCSKLMQFDDVMLISFLHCREVSPRATILAWLQILVNNNLCLCHQVLLRG